jgi:NADPH:quinone reductase-like Zn-dependent oxidoreductase
VQLAKWKDAHVIATASKNNHCMLHELGVDQAIDDTTQRFEDVARNVDIVLDPIGSKIQERVMENPEKGRTPGVAASAAICRKSQGARCSRRVRSHSAKRGSADRNRGRN